MSSKLGIDGAHELVGSLELKLPLERYRERLAPLATAILAGAPPATIEVRRRAVSPCVCDPMLTRIVQEGVERLSVLIDLAREELAAGLGTGPFAHAVLDRLMFELLEHHDRNLESLERMEAELRELEPGERPACAAFALRGAVVAARIPRNEIRAAIVRVSRATAKRGFRRQDAAEEAARKLARLLATDERRAAVRDWASAMSIGIDEGLPLLAAELRGWAETPPAADPGDDHVWVQACVGLSLEESINAGV